MKLGIGIDTGGTYTDAVLYDFEEKKVIAKGKALTTKENLEVGISNAMDTLPDDLLRQAKILALSTTLATNACVEKKGGRAKLILLGTSEKVMKWIDAKARYGLTAGEDTLCIDSKSVMEPEIKGTPEWFEQLMEQAEWLSDAQALAVAEVPAMNNGAMGERYAKEKLKEKYPVPLITSSELALGLNVMERGATALLNARLLPVIDEFLKAIQASLKRKKLSVTSMIVRSDGSLMSEKYTKAYPVQTMLSGPASSVIGARNLAKAEQCLIVDMGGTTTDISLVRDGSPKMSRRISIGGYQTQVRGVYIDTFGLGGDSRITAENEKLTLHTRRVQPLCIAAAEHPEITEKLRKLLESGRTHTYPLHELICLVKQPGNRAHYTRLENELIDQLMRGPVMLGDEGVDIYNLKTDRLENEGIVMRCGLTPTDIMHIRGDFSKYGREASRLGALYVMRNLEKFKGASLDAFCEAAYEAVCRKLYENILRILFLNQYPDIFPHGMTKEVQALISRSWEEKKGVDFFGMNFTVKPCLVGIGAPTHIFLPMVAKMLGVPCLVPEHAEVANAVGAITADITGRSEITISAHYSLDEKDAFTVHLPDRNVNFKEMGEAIAFAEEQAKAAAVSEAREKGALGELTVQLNTDKNQASDRYGTVIMLDTTVEAIASGRI